MNSEIVSIIILTVGGLQSKRASSIESVLVLSFLESAEIWFSSLFYTEELQISY